MPEPRIQITTNPPDLFQRMARYPRELDNELSSTMDEALYHVHGSVPPYPVQRAGSRYVRTGTLGRTLGTSMAGGRSGHPDTRSVKRIGAGKYTGTFGTRLSYAPPVIGALTQKALFKSLGWWTMETVKKKAEPGVIRLFKLMSERLVRFLDGR